MKRLRRVAFVTLVLGAVLVSALPAGADTQLTKATLKEFALPDPTIVHHSGITLGPDNNIWFTNFSGASIARITSTGVITEFPIPGNGGPFPVDPREGITTGPDGALWFCAEGSTNTVQRFDLGTETFTGFPITNPCHYITTGPDGNLWYTESDFGTIGRLTTGGDLTEFAVGGSPDGIVTGPDGNLWFGDFAGGVGRITPAGDVTHFPVENTLSGQITVGPDGRLWFTGFNFNLGHGIIGRISTSGNARLFNQAANYITSAPDGRLWFTFGGSSVTGAGIGAITTTGKVTRLRLPTGYAQPNGIAVGLIPTQSPTSFNAVWFTETDVNRIGVIRGLSRFT